MLLSKSEAHVLHGKVQELEEVLAGERGRSRCGRRVSVCVAVISPVTQKHVSEGGHRVPGVVDMLIPQRGE